MKIRRTTNKYGDRCAVPEWEDEERKAFICTSRLRAAELFEKKL